MSWQYYINMESLALEIADTHICKMTDNNLDRVEALYLDEDSFIANLKHGFIAIVMLTTYFESFVNSLIRLECGDYAESLIKKPIKDKLKHLYNLKGLDSDRYKGMTNDETYNEYNKVVNVRHEMIHYKVSTKEHASSLADFKIANTYASSFFTKSNLSKGKDSIVELAKIIAEDLGCGIQDDLPIVSNDGMGNIFKYVYDLDC